MLTFPEGHAPRYGEFSIQSIRDAMNTCFNGFCADTTSSMHRDLLAGHPCDLADQVGTVFHQVQRAAVTAPVLDLVYAATSPREARARRKS